jgi:hypothetical protein
MLVLYNIFLFDILVVTMSLYRKTAFNKYYLKGYSLILKATTVM